MVQAKIAAKYRWGYYLIYWIKDELATTNYLEAKLFNHGTVKISVIDFSDSGGNNMNEWDRRADEIKGLIDSGKRVIVFCQLGISRSNAMAATVLKKLGMDINDAFNLVKSKVPIAMIEPDLWGDITQKYGDFKFSELKEKDSNLHL